MIFKPHPYQSAAIKFMLSRKAAGIFADPGLGKTATTLQYIRTRKLLKPDLKTLIVAPLRVVYTVWQQEIQKWDNFRHLTSTKLHGPRKGLKACYDRDIYLINPEGLGWLLGRKDFEFDVLIVDESSKFKSARSKRFKLLKKNLDRFDSRFILTGTPTPRSLEDLWAQIYILDKGAALGHYITHYRNKYFYPTGYKNYQYTLKPGADEVIYRKAAPLVMRIDAETHLDLPALIDNRITVELSSAAKKIYNGLRDKLFAEIDDAQHFVPSSAAAYNACCQVANGALYDQQIDGFEIKSLETFKEIHTAKLDALVDLVDELQGKPVLVAYRYRHDLARLKGRFGAKTPHIGGDTSAEETKRIVERWNRGEIPLLFSNPQSMAHGLNLQGGGNDVVWFGLTDNFEDYDQFNRRIYRQGVGGQVRIHHIIAAGTVDQLILKRCGDKEARQESLFQALQNFMKA